MYSLDERFIITVSTFPECEESRELSLQVPINVDLYVVKLIIVFTLYKEGLINTELYHFINIFNKNTFEMLL